MTDLKLQPSNGNQRLRTAFISTLRIEYGSLRNTSKVNLHPKWRKKLKVLRSKGIKLSRIFRMLVLKGVTVGLQDPWEFELFEKVSLQFYNSKDALAFEVLSKHFEDKSFWHRTSRENLTEEHRLGNLKFLIEYYGFDITNLRQAKGQIRHVFKLMIEYLTTDSLSSEKDLRNNVKRNRIRGYRDHGSLATNPHARKADKTGGQLNYELREIFALNQIKLIEGRDHFETKWLYYEHCRNEFLMQRYRNLVVRITKILIRLHILPIMLKIA